MRVPVRFRFNNLSVDSTEGEQHEELKSRFKLSIGEGGVLSENRTEDTVVWKTKGGQEYYVKIISNDEKR